METKTYNVFYTDQACIQFLFDEEDIKKVQYAMESGKNFVKIHSGIFGTADIRAIVEVKPIEDIPQLNFPDMDEKEARWMLEQGLIDRTTYQLLEEQGVIKK